LFVPIHLRNATGTTEAAKLLAKGDLANSLTPAGSP
jgi:hypothetical protein